HRERGGVLVELADERVCLGGIEAVAAQLLEARDEAAVAGVALDGQALGSRDIAVRSVADDLAAERTEQPGNVGAPVGAAEDPDERIDEPGPEPADQRRKPPDPGTSLGWRLLDFRLGHGGERYHTLGLCHLVGLDAVSLARDHCDADVSPQRRSRLADIARTGVPLTG